MEYHDLCKELLLFAPPDTRIVGLISMTNIFKLIRINRIISLIQIMIDWYIFVSFQCYLTLCWSIIVMLSVLFSLS